MTELQENQVKQIIKSLLDLEDPKALVYLQEIQIRNLSEVHHDYIDINIRLIQGKK